MPVLTEIPGNDLDLVPRETLMSAHPEEFRGVVRIGVPDVFDAVAYAVAAGTDPDPSIMLLQESYKFSLVRLPLSVRPRGDMKVRFLAVECVLRGSGGESICWSMAPERIEDEVTVSTSAKLGAGLTVNVLKADAEVSADEELVVYQPHIVAFGLHVPELALELKPTKGRDVRGVQLLHFVTRTPRGVSADCSVRMRLDVSMKRLLWNTVAVVEDGSSEVTRFVITPVNTS